MRTERVTGGWSRAPARRETALLVTILASIGAFYVATIRDGHYWGDDFAQYILHARAIATGTPYAGLPFVTESFSLRPAAYPPMYPLLLAPLYRVFGLALTPMKIEGIAIFLAALAVLFVLFRGALTLRSRLWLLGVMGLSPYFWQTKDDVLSDWPFLFFFCVAALAIDRIWADEHTVRRQPIGRGLLVALLVYLACATRSVGIVMLPALVIYSVVRFRAVPLAVWIAVGGTLVLAAAQSLVMQDPHGYLGFFGTNVFRPSSASIWRGIVFYGKTLSTIWDDGHAGSLRIAMYMVTIALALIGAAGPRRRAVRVLDLAVLFYGCAVIVWPFLQGMRFLIPIVPVYLFYVFLGVEQIGDWRGPRVEALVLAAVLAGTGLAYGLKYSTMSLRAPLSDIASPDTQDFFRFIRTETPPDAVIQFNRLRALALFGERRTFEYRDVPGSDESFWEDLRRGHVTYVTTAPMDGSVWTAFVARHAGCWDEVYANPHFHVYRIRTDIAAGDRACPLRQP